MNLSALKSFAQETRRDLLEAVERKLDYVLTSDTPDLRAASAQVAHLRQEAEAHRSQLIERVAYTWFNRLAALRFLDARGWHPFRVRVVTAATTAETQPEILRQVRNGVVPEELEAHLDKDRLADLLAGRLPSNNPQREVYRHLVLGACRYYHALLPFLFEAIDDETELLLPDDLLTEQSVAQGFRTEISDEDCAEVEILGWLYQFYISEKKDQVMARKAAVPSEDIPAVTQLFTPHWIVRYLVENSLGRLWMHSRPGSNLRSAMPYYVEDPDGHAPADSLTVERPEDIRLLDPACGSGHMLTYAFDLLYKIYEEEGYAPADIPEKILGYNLYGLEICPRATQLAQFALLAKARQKTASAFKEAKQPQVMCLEDVSFEEGELKAWFTSGNLTLIFTERVLQQVHQFRENTSTFGSLIQPILNAEEIAKLNAQLEEAPEPTDLLQAETKRKVLLALAQAEMLTQRYHAVVTNPPYMGGKQLNSKVKGFAESEYPDSRADLFAMFIDRSLLLALRNAYSALVTMHSWMFLSSYESLREKIVSGRGIVSMAHLGPRAFDSLGGEVVQTTAFVVINGPSIDEGVFFRLTEERSEAAKSRALLAGVSDADSAHRYLAREALFRAIPGTPIAYWISDSLARAFGLGQRLGDVARPCVGLQTGDNARFLRGWAEVAGESIALGVTDHHSAEESKRKWFPYNKGGDFQRWYGNQEFVVNWEDGGRELLDFRPRSVIRNPDCFFKPSASWSKVSGGLPAFRFYDEGFLFDVAGTSIFTESRRRLLEILAFSNSLVTRTLLEVLSPTLNFEVGQVATLPIVSSSSNNSAPAPVEELICLARSDWDDFETSWDFQDLPLLRPELKGMNLEESWQNWERYLKANIARMQELETGNNRLWIEAYGLQDELEPEVPEEEITLARPDRRKDAAAFLSYAVGCMMGRYSLDKPGLILADAGDTLEDYLEKVGKSQDEISFLPDEDAAIPVLDGEWFEDDIVTRVREFVRVTFGPATLEQNLRFLEESLGKDLRRYFLTDFYKDHLQTYKKRPIYWMFQSPKRGFQCLIYLHRYTKDTPNRVLSRYLREYLEKIRYRLDHLEHLLASESTSNRDKTQARKETEQLKKTLRECEDYERDVLLPLAQQRPELDLDDGVKVNYLKLGKALAPIPGLKGAEE